MQKIIYSSHFIVFQNDKVLLVRHGQEAGHLEGVYGIPGGRFEKGESMIEVAKRELEEESGLKPVDFRDYPNNKYTADIQRKDGVKRMTMNVFICNKFSGDLRDSPESKPEWVKITALDNYSLLPNVKNAIGDALNFLKNE